MSGPDNPTSRKASRRGTFGERNRPRAGRRRGRDPRPAGRRVLRRRRVLHALPRAARRRAGRRRHGALPVAPRVLQPAHRRGAARAGARPDRLLARRAGRRHASSSARSSRAPAPASRAVEPAQASPASVVIVGGGAAGLAAADMLRREGYGGSLTMISADDSPPYDRPNLSKDFLAGTAPDDWIPLRGAGVLPRPAHRARARLARVVARRPRRSGCSSRAASGYGFDALLLATGADPVRLADRGRRGVAGALPAHASPTAGRSSPGPRRRSAWSSSARASSASRSRPRCARAGSTSTSSRPSSSRSSACSGRSSARFVRGLHEAHGVVFHLGETVEPRRRTRR